MLLLPISAILIVMAMPVVFMPLIVVVRTAYFCLSNRNGNIYYDRASLSGSMLPVSVVRLVMAMPIVILPLIVIVRTAFFCTAHAYGNAISLNASSGSV